MNQKSAFISFLLATTLISICAAQAPELPGTVWTVTTDNFASLLGKHDYLFLEFYTTHCQPCQRLVLELPEIARRVHAYNRRVGLGKVDGSEEKALAEKFTVHGFPTLLLITKGGQKEYTGGKTIREISDWIKKQTTPLVETILFEKDVEQAAKEYEVLFIYLGDSKSANFNHYLYVARRFLSDSTMTFLTSPSDELKEKYQVKEEGTIVNLKRFGKESPMRLLPPYEAGDIYNFVVANEFPDVRPFSTKVADLLFSKLTTCLLLLRGRTNKDAIAQKEFLETKDLLKQKIPLVLVDVTESLGERLVEFLGIQIHDIPTVRIVVPTEQDYTQYALNGTITNETILNFVAQFEEKKLIPVEHAEEPEFQETPDGVRRTFPKTKSPFVEDVPPEKYKEAVLSDEHETLVEVYATWCDKCPKFGEKINTLAERFHKTKGLKFVRVDGTKNNIPGVIVDGFPTVFFYNKDNEVPAMYDGDYSYEEIVHFLKTQTTVELEDIYQDGTKVEGSNEYMHRYLKHEDIFPRDPNEPYRHYEEL